MHATPTIRSSVNYGAYCCCSAEHVVTVCLAWDDGVYRSLSCKNDAFALVLFLNGGLTEIGATVSAFADANSSANITNHQPRGLFCFTKWNCNGKRESKHDGLFHTRTGQGVEESSTAVPQGPEALKPRCPPKPSALYPVSRPRIFKIDSGQQGESTNSKSLCSQFMDSVDVNFPANAV